MPCLKTLISFLPMRTIAILGEYQYAQNIGIQFYAAAIAILVFGGWTSGAISDATDTTE
jgi:hypothetical protein